MHTVGLAKRYGGTRESYAPDSPFQLLDPPSAVEPAPAREEVGS